MSYDRVRLFFVVACLVVAGVGALSCGTCNRDDCRVLSCQGGVVDDECNCCQECAKLVGQSCAGPFNKFGQCDKGLVCELILKVGDFINSDAHGICAEIQTGDEGTSSLLESSQHSQGSQDSTYSGCEMKLFSGCNLLRSGIGLNGVDEERCACSEGIIACIDPFDFANSETCEQARSVRNGTEPEPLTADCSQARCEIVFDIQCPPDSVKIEAQPEQGECCPRPPQCLCDVGACPEPVCAMGYQYHEIAMAEGRPGACCNKFECRPNVNASNCNGVVCPESSHEMCPSDSKAVMGGMSPNGCCLLPSRCTCALERCVIPVCSQGFSPRRTANGNMEPGSCCDVYECVVGIVTEGCAHNGMAYRDGDSWSAGAGDCKTCRCDGGWAHCIVQQDCTPAEETRLCLTRQGIKMPGERWDEDDCTMCECVNGAPACMTSSCVVKCLNPRTVPGICCPVCDTVSNYVTMNPVGCPQSNCTLLCPHGYNKDENNCHVCQCLTEIPTTRHTPQTSISTPATGHHDTTESTESSTDHIEVVCPLIDCPNSCPFGFKTDLHGCSLCDCIPDGVICEDMSLCDMACPFGYRRDTNGCPTCRCQQCRPMDSCTKSCLYGYQVGRNGCHKCRCARCPPLTDCKKDCMHGFELNDRGCEICKCQAYPVIATRPAVPSESSCVSVDGFVYDDGESWHDGCRQCYCSNGQEMCSLLTCQVPACSKPVIRPGHCCPTCPDDPEMGISTILAQVCQSANGHYYVEGETWLMGTCTSCMCHSGRVLCSPEVCPPLPCRDPIFREGQCCAECLEGFPEQPSIDPSSDGASCLMPGGVTFQHGASWKEDSCTSCQCIGGEAACFSQTCPPVNCRRPLLKKGQCCPTCLDPEIRHVCKYGGDVYVDGETWRVDNCTTCVCESGRVACTSLKCPEGLCINPVHISGKCCPSCPDGGLIHQTKQPGRTSHTDNKDFDATEPVPWPVQPVHHVPNKNDATSLEGYDDGIEPPVASEHHPFPVYPVIMSILVIMLAICIILLLLLFVTKRRHRLLYHVNVKPVAVKGQTPVPATTKGMAASKAKNTDSKTSNNRDSIRDSAMFKDNLPAKAGMNVTLDSQELKRYSDLFAVGKNIQPV